MLAAVDVDRVTPAMTAAQKVAHFVKITMLFLEEENAVDAERFFVKVRLKCWEPNFVAAFKRMLVRIMWHVGLPLQCTSRAEV